MSEQTTEGPYNLRIHEGNVEVTIEGQGTRSLPFANAVRALFVAGARRSMEPVFRLVLPLGTAVEKARKGGPALPLGRAFAPTLNEYDKILPWMKKELRKALDWAIVQEKSKWPAWSCGCVDKTAVETFTKIVKGKPQKVTEPRTTRHGGRRRRVVVTRYSAVRPDEISVDIVGGKAPIDRLVLAGVLRGDSQQWLERDADWQKVDQNEGRVVIEVFEFDDYAEAVAK